MIVVEIRVNFEFDNSEIDEVDLRLKIRIFTIICFYFTSISFL